VVGIDLVELRAQAGLDLVFRALPDRVPALAEFGLLQGAIVVRVPGL
jgi:hypothetical protein